MPALLKAMKLHNSYKVIFLVLFLKICFYCVLSPTVVSDSVRLHGLYLAKLLCPCISPGKNTGVGNCSLLQGIFLNQGMNCSLLHCRKILYHQNHQTNPKIHFIFFLFFFFFFNWNIVDLQCCASFRYTE